MDTQNRLAAVGGEGSRGTEGKKDEGTKQYMCDTQTRPTICMQCGDSQRERGVWGGGSAQRVGKWGNEETSLWVVQA